MPAAVLRLVDVLDDERDRWFLWVPVCAAIGIGVYFALPTEPMMGLALPAAVVAAAMMVWLRRGPLALIVSAAVLAAALGFSLAQIRVWTVDAPILAKRHGPTWAEGSVVSSERRPNAYRLTLSAVQIRGLAAPQTPARVRITVRARSVPAPRPGQRIGIMAVLMPPPMPHSPAAFDFPRQAYFQQLGGVGYAVSAPKVVVDPDPDALRPMAVIAEVRQSIAGHVRATVPGMAGKVAAALMTGERGDIDPAVLDAMRDAGLAHLLAISGLHMGLVAGFVFLLLRGGLALWPSVALSYPIKKWAAVGSLGAAFCYLFVAGASVSTQRAFMMTALVLVAVLVDRRALSMRTVAWAALVLLALSPESVLHVGFQMSFAAVVALIATYEIAGPKFRNLRQSGGLGRRLVLYLGAVALTTVIAGFASGLIALFHFNRVISYGLVANLVAVPVMALWVMPAAVLSFVLMPFGLAVLALIPMGMGIEVIVGVARAIADLPGAVSVVSAMPMAGLIAIALGGLWLCLWRRRWRLFGIAGLVAGVLSLGAYRPPDMLINGDGKLTAVRAEGGGLMVSSRRAGRNVRAAWLRRDGLSHAEPWPNAGPSGDGRLRCDGLGCIYRVNGWVAALPRHEGALPEDCRTADVIVASVPVRVRCSSARIIVDRFDVWREGAHAVYLPKTGPPRAISVNDVRGRRPWVVDPSRRRMSN
jgi:competence protein ComEC